MSKNYKTMDGNTAAAYSSYAFIDVAAIYPITPSPPWPKNLKNGLRRENQSFLVKR